MFNTSNKFINLSNLSEKRIGKNDSGYWKYRNKEISVVIEHKLL